jgi:hypothetical protein
MKFKTFNLVAIGFMAAALVMGCGKTLEKKYGIILQNVHRSGILARYCF